MKFTDVHRGLSNAMEGKGRSTTNARNVKEWHLKSRSERNQYKL